jgi:hypothetical protein
VGQGACSFSEPICSGIGLRAEDIDWSFGPSWRTRYAAVSIGWPRDITARDFSYSGGELR